MFLVNRNDMLGQNGSHDAQTARLFQAAKETLFPAKEPSGKTGTPKDPRIVTKREERPVNEFGENDILYYSLFPHLFLFARGIKNQGTLPPKLVNHLLHQRSCAFAKDSRYLFTAFNQKQRHAATSAVNAFASGKPEEIEKLGALVASEEFKAKVEAAAKSPEGDEAKEVLRILGSHLRFTGRHVDFSPLARSDSITSIHANSQFHGCPSVFFTVAPDDVHSVMSIRMCVPTGEGNGNAHFPAKDEGLVKNLLDRAQSFEIAKLPIGECDLKKMIAENPVAAAEIFKETLEAIFTALLGLPPERLSRKTKPLGALHKGAFGECTAVYSVIETQGRLSLHAHMAVWTVLRPSVIQNCSAYEELATEIAKVFDSQFVAELPVRFHCQALTRLATKPSDRLPQSPVRLTYQLSPLPNTPDGEKAFLEWVYEVINRVGIHAHSKTCEKGPHGQICCRLAFLRDFVMKTRPVQLVSEVKADGTSSFKVLDSIEILQSSPRNYRESPLPPVDRRCIVWELKRPHINPHEFKGSPGSADEKEFQAFQQFLQSQDAETRNILERVLEERNQATVESSPTISASVAGNTAAYPLGGFEQAKSILFYLIKYMSKDQAPLASSLAVIKYAFDKINLYPSTASDAGTDLRTGKHLLMAILNKISGIAEISDTQAAASLLGLPAQEGTAKEVFVFVKNAVAFVEEMELRMAGKDPKGAWRDDDDEDQHPTEAEPENLEKEEEEGAENQSPEELFQFLFPDEGSVELPTGRGTKSKWGRAPIFQAEDKEGKPTYVVVPQHLNYAHRGKGLECLNLLEYVCIIEVIQKQKKQKQKQKQKEQEQEQDDHDDPQDSDADDDDDGGEESEGEHTDVLQRRPKNTCFDFGPEHPLHRTHTQRIRSKILLPVLAGGPPPSFRFLDSSSAKFSKCSAAAQAEMIKGARTFMTLLSPWKLKSEPGNLRPGELQPVDGTDWNSFTDFMKKLDGGEDEEATFLGRCMSGYIVDVARNLRVITTNKQIMTQYRTRKVRPWKSTAVDPCNVGNFFNDKWAGKARAKTMNDGDEKKELDETSLCYQEIEVIRDMQRSDGKPTQEEKEDQFLQHTKDVFEGLYDNGDNNGSNAPRAELPIGKSLLYQSDQVKISEVWDSLKSKKETLSESEERLDPFTVKKKASEILQQLKETDDQAKKPTSDQLKALNILADHVDQYQNHFFDPKQPKPNQLRLLILGGPGVGKTWTINAIREMARQSFLGTCSSAFTGAAACLLPGSETCNSLLAIPATEKDVLKNESVLPLNPNALQALREKLKGKEYFIIDEISMVDATFLGKMSERLCEVFSSNEPFGGKNVVLVGDFFQLKPVAGSALYTDVLRHFHVLPGSNDDSPSKPKYAGSQAFSKFRLVELKEQVRAADDQEQANFLERMRDFNVQDPISDELLKSLVERTLSKDDVNSSTSNLEDSWDMAPVCVTSNAERFNLTPIRAKRFAQRKGVPLVTWNLASKGTLITKANDAGFAEKLFTLESGLLGMFVEGAPAYINQNINPSMGLANGTYVVMHSLSFNENVSQRELGEIERQLNHAKPGERVHLPFPPQFINVSVPLPQEIAKNWPPDSTLVPGEVVIPIGLCTSKTRIKAKCQFQNKLYKGNVDLTEHRVEFGFVVTFHKVQGKTLNKVILELNKRPFQPSLTFNMLLVALSRVKSREGIRIVKLRTGNNLDYLKQLKRDSDLRIWLAGFDQNGIWNAGVSANQVQAKEVAPKGKRKGDHVSRDSKRAKTSPEKIPGDVPGGKIPGDAPGGKIPGGVPGGKIPGGVPGGKIPGDVSGGKIPGDVPGGKIPGDAPGGKIPGDVPGGKIPGDVPGGKIPAGGVVPPKLPQQGKEKERDLEIDEIRSSKRPKLADYRQVIPGSPQERFGRERALPWSDNSCHIDVVAESLYACHLELQLPLPNMECEEMFRSLQTANSEEEIWNSVMTIRHNLGNLSPQQCFGLRRIYWRKLAKQIRFDCRVGSMGEVAPWTGLSYNQTIFNHAYQNDVKIRDGFIHHKEGFAEEREIMVVEMHDDRVDLDCLVVTDNHTSYSIVAFARHANRHFTAYIRFLIKFSSQFPFSDFSFSFFFQEGKPVALLRRHSKGRRWFSSVASHPWAEESRHGERQRYDFCCSCGRLVMLLFFSTFSPKEDDQLTRVASFERRTPSHLRYYLQLLHYGNGIILVFLMALEYLILYIGMELI